MYLYCLLRSVITWKFAKSIFGFGKCGSVDLDYIVVIIVVLVLIATTLGSRDDWLELEFELFEKLGM